MLFSTYRIVYSILLLLGPPLMLSLYHPSFGERKPSISMSQYYMMMLTKILTFLSHSARVWRIPFIIVLALILSFGTKLSTNLNFNETFKWEKIFMSHSASLFLSLSMITGIPSAKEVSRDRCLILNFVLIRVIHPLVCCWQPVYSFHECKTMTTQRADLEANGLITDCVGVCSSLLLLAAILH